MTTSYDRVHWRLTNIFMRLFGICAGLVGLAFLVVGPRLGAAFAIPLAFAFLRIRPYRPDQGDVSYLADPFGARGNSAGRRSWWTGEDRD